MKFLFKDFEPALTRFELLEGMENCFTFLAPANFQLEFDDLNSEFPTFRGGS
jgi:hypothetical protein